MRRVAVASGTSLRRPPSLGFKLIPENDYDMENRRLANVMDSANSNDVLNLKYYLSSRNYFGGSRLLEAIRDNETSMRAYINMLTRDGEAAMRMHYKTYFDNANAQMWKIVEKINSNNYAVEHDINGIIANKIPSVVKTMVLELVREKVDLKTRFGSFNSRVANIQKEILAKIPDLIKIAVEESTKERDIIIDDLKAQLYNLNKRIELLDVGGGGGIGTENKRIKST
ncbi:hypothetical protein FQA39_LY08840 [Lamprigera yunnana]|nr:hypothetical protein FQA39_LY08840 [Lamprigera yunnana]